MLRSKACGCALSLSLNSEGDLFWAENMDCEWHIFHSNQSWALYTGDKVEKKRKCDEAVKLSWLLGRKKVKFAETSICWLIWDYVSPDSEDSVFQ